MPEADKDQIAAVVVGAIVKTLDPIITDEESRGRSRPA